MIRSSTLKHISVTAGGPSLLLPLFLKDYHRDTFNIPEDFVCANLNNSELPMLVDIIDSLLLDNAENR